MVAIEVEWGLVEYRTSSGWFRTCWKAFSVYINIMKINYFRYLVMKLLNFEKDKLVLTENFHTPCNSRIVYIFKKTTSCTRVISLY
jgi:hypothetical protein